MNFHYDKESDSLYIELSPHTSFDSEEVAEGVVVDYDKNGHIVGLDIEDASKHVSLTDMHFSGFIPNVDVKSE